MEGQISKPQPSGESDADSFVDDSTDNTYGYYTIMGVYHSDWGGYGGAV